MTKAKSKNVTNFIGYGYLRYKRLFDYDSKTRADFMNYVFKFLSTKVKTRS